MNVIPTEAHFSHWVADRAIAFIDDSEERAADQPFFLIANFFDPHHPFGAPDEFRKLIDADAIPGPVRADGELASKPAVQTLYSERSYSGWAPGYQEYSSDEIKELRASYLAMVALVDAEVGRVLDALDASVQSNNTVVVFTSDHGEMLGDHEQLLKGPMMYEGCTRVPLIIRWPEQVPASTRVENLVQWIDLSATYLNVSGAKGEHRGQGASLMELFENDTDWRDWALCEYRDSSHPGNPAVHTTMLRYEQWKLVIWHGAPATEREMDGELYDLVADPNELTNLYHNAEHRDVRERLKDQLLNVLGHRSVIAMALAGQPAILIADEPTTALDVTVQAQIVDLIRNLQNSRQVASVVITHDLGLVAELSQRVVVMYAGRIVEEAPVEDLFNAPAHPYTRALLESRPSSQVNKDRLAFIPGLPPAAADAVTGCAFYPRCAFAKDKFRTEVPSLQRHAPERRVACHFLTELVHNTSQDLQTDSIQAVEEPTGQIVLKIDNITKAFGAVRAVNGIDLILRRGETLGLAGESGCGKSTLARLIMGLFAPDSGRVEINGYELSSLKGAELRAARRDIQMVFQDPTSSLDRRMTIRNIVAEPMQIAGLPKQKINARLSELFESVSLPERYLSSRPAELSGGQRQRVGIARALALEPKVILLDEPTSALDVSVQAQVVNLLDDLRQTSSAGCISITHDLGVLQHVSDRIAIMYLGKLVEIGSKAEIFSSSRHPYTRALLTSVPADHPADRSTERFIISGASPDPANIPAGCSFRHRCPLATALCETTEPELESVENSEHLVACHFRADLTRLATLAIRDSS